MNGVVRSAKARGLEGAGPGFTWVYGFAHGGKNLFWQTGELLFAYFLTEACGLRADQMGAVLGGSLLVSALADISMGAFLGRWVKSVSGAGIFQLIGTILSAATFCAFALTAAIPPGPMRFGFAITASLAFRLSYALAENPHNAMLAFATGNDDARAHLSSIRYVFGGLASVAVAAAFGPMFQQGDAKAHAEHFVIFAVAVSSVAVGTSFALWRFLRSWRAPPRALQTKTAAGRQGAPPLPLWTVLAVVTLVVVAISIFGRLEPYLVTYNLPQPEQGGALLVSIAIGNLASQPFWAALARRSSLKTTLVVGCAALATGSLVFGLLASHGVVVGALGGGVYGWACGGVLMSLWALAAAAGKEARTTLVFGAFTGVSKCALALAAFSVAALVDRFSDSANAVTGDWILPVMTCAPALAGLVSIGLIVTLHPTSAGGTRTMAGVPRRNRQSQPGRRTPWLPTPRAPQTPASSPTAAAASPGARSRTAASGRSPSAHRPRPPAARWRRPKIRSPAPTP